MPAINPDRLLGDLYALRRIGAYKTGVHRPTFSPDDLAARQWLVDRMTAAARIVALNRRLAQLSLLLPPSADRR